MWPKAVRLVVVLATALMSASPAQTAAVIGTNSVHTDSALRFAAPTALPDDERREVDKSPRSFGMAGRASLACTDSSLRNLGPGVLRKEAGGVAEQFTALLLSSDELWKFRRSLESRYGHEFSLQPQESYVLSYDSLVGAYLPISGGAGHSFYTMWFDRASRQVVKTAAALFQRDSNANIRAELAVDSALVMDAVLTPEGEIVSGVMEVDGQAIPLDRLRPASPTGFWDCLLECLGKDPLVPPWILPILSIICGVLCLSGPTPPCIICIIIQGGLLVIPCIELCGPKVHLGYLPMITRISR